MVGGMTLNEPRGQSETRAGRDSATLADRRYSDPEHGGVAGERRQRNSFEGSGNREDVALPDLVFHLWCRDRQQGVREIDSGRSGVDQQALPRGRKL